MAKASFPTPPLVVHVLGDVPGSPEHVRHRLARTLYTQFNRDYDNPLSRGIGIPVYLWDSPAYAERIRLEDARSSVLVPLVDDAITVDPEWCEVLERLSQRVQDSGGAHRMFPVALTQGALNVGLEKTNFIQLQRRKGFEARRTGLVERLTHELCRLLYGRETVKQASPGARPSLELFISHAKLDGLKIAEQLRDYVHKRLELGTFFDAIDIPPGEDFAKVLEERAGRASLIAIQTDAYGTREWCRREVLVAKNHGRPVVVVNAVEQGEERSFPYLGNVPTLRWAPDRPRDASRASDALALVLREVLRDAYFREHLKALGALKHSAGEYVVLPRPPELMTFRRARGSRVLLYPDPPLGDEEVELLTDHQPRTRLLTPTLMAVRDDKGRPLRLDGVVVGISVGDEPAVREHGCTDEHLLDATLQFVRYLLACGGTFAHGGDLRENGYTQQFMQLVRQHNRAGEEARLLSFLSWPWKNLDTKLQATYRPQVKFCPVDPPPDIAAETRKRKLSDDRRAYVKARCFTQMREEMNARLDARVVLGGKLTGFSGRCPGILEETLLALERGLPTFVLGGFGGCAEAVGQALLGKRPEVLTEKSQRSAARYDAVFRQFQAEAPELVPDYSASVDFLRREGIEGLDNGLSRAENERLLESVNLDEITTLIFKGLGRKLGKARGR